MSIQMLAYFKHMNHCPPMPLLEIVLLSDMGGFIFHL